MNADLPDSQRVDQWLWHTRIVKTRTLAARLVEGGKVRINKIKVKKAGSTIQPGDVLSFMHAKKLWVIEVVSTSTRRGPATEARRIYRELQPDNQSTHGDQGSEPKKGGA